MLRNGMDFLMIPGPTTVPLEVLRAMHRPSIEIYDGPIVETSEACHRDLKTIFRTRSGHVYIYVANGHGAWDGALTNTLSRGDKVLVLDAGRFAREWGVAADKMGIVVEVLPGSWRAAVDPAAVQQRLEADRQHEIRAVLVAQVDTGSGVINDLPAIRKAIDAARHPALLMADVVASLACVPFEMEDWGIDVAVGASQKGLMSPAGLSFVAAGRKAHAAAEHANLKTRYMDWEERRADATYMKYAGTPPEQLLYGLRAAIDMILAEGVEEVWRRHAVIGETIRAALTAWSTEGGIEPNIMEPAQRSNAVTVLLVNDGKANALRAKLSATCGVSISATIGEIAGTGLRIGHMGHVNAPMVLGTLGCFQASLDALGIPYGKGGLDAAVAVVGKAIAAA
jgi:alanine-glyoxylate transaminase / serine-glyoxylate transaminase / serine-pyruvate transaminase